ncbi:MAG: FAD-binding protein, partial [Clostridia bacterium]|nr:FAD-binding protein [Clostridia bacterium]
MRNLITESITCDVLVIGGGLAALTAAYAASSSGAKVLMACKKNVGKSGNTLVAANGFAAVLPGYDPADSLDSHFTDTMSGGAMINDENLVRMLVDKAAVTLEELERLGVCFQSMGARKIVKKAPGHSHMRFFNVRGFNGAFFAQGRGITFPLAEKVGQAGVKFLDQTMITSLLVQDGRVTGAQGLSLREKCLVLIKAKTVIISSGGGGRIYHSTNNTSDATGDGYALALNAGASLRDMEFIQFFPSSMVYPFKLTVPTPLFADGAVLKNALGHRFMFDYAPEGEMATRDIVARAVYLEMQQGRRCREGIQIDFSSIPDKVLESKYAVLVKHFRKSGHEIKTGYFEVAPVVHHFMGGITIDEKCRTQIQGL